MVLIRKIKIAPIGVVFLFNSALEALSLSTNNLNVKLKVDLLIKNLLEFVDTYINTYIAWTMVEINQKDK